MLPGMREGLRGAKWPGVLLLGLTALLLIPLPAIPGVSQHPALAGELESIGHPFAFALIAWLAYGPACTGRPVPGSPFVLILALAAFGALTELAQALTGRDPSLRDWLGDLTGTGASVLWKWGREEHQGTACRRIASIGAALCVLIASAPLLFTLAAYDGRARAWPQIWSAESRLLQRFSSVHQGPFPGLEIGESNADWSAYRSLVVKARNLRGEYVDLRIRVHDRLHNKRYDDRFNRQVMLPPGESSLRIPLTEIGAGPARRQLDMRQIAGVMLFSNTPDKAAPFEIDSVYLEP